MQVLYHGAVKAEWVDYNGHMGDFAYSIVFTDGVDAFAALIGVPRLLMSEIRIAFLREVHEADPFHVALTLLGYDRQSIHAVLDMVDEKTGRNAARAELRLVAGTYDVERRLTPHPFSLELMALLQRMMAAGTPLSDDWPDSKIGIRRAKA